MSDSYIWGYEFPDKKSEGIPILKHEGHTYKKGDRIRDREINRFGTIVGFEVGYPYIIIIHWDRGRIRQRIRPSAIRPLTVVEMLADG